MKLHVMSDLHLEIASFNLQPIEADALVLAGDICDYYGFIEEAKKYYEKVIYVPGNHDYWGKSYFDFEEPEVFEFKGFTFLAATFWSKIVNQESVRALMDFKRIRGLTQERYNYEYEKTLKLYEEVKPDIVVSHHAPSFRSVGQKYLGSIYNECFAAHTLMYSKHVPKLWIHGHMHTSSDYIIREKCRVICNPRGYRDENIEFNPKLAIEVV